VGEPPPASAKVCVTATGGHRNAMTLAVTGLHQRAKADLVRRQLAPVLARASQADVTLVPAGPCRSDLRITVRDGDPRRVGRAFSSAVVELALASYPGLYPTHPPGDAVPYGVCWPTQVPAAALTQSVVLAGDTVAEVPALSPAASSPDAARLPPAGTGDPAAGEAAASAPRGPTRRVALGELAGARSGDKGGDANVGIWVRRPDAYGWLLSTIIPDWVRAAVPDAAGHPIVVHRFPNLLAVNVVVHGLLGRGVAENVRDDAQAKALGEWLRAQPVDVPAGLLPGAAAP
jgi:hypothetical protein